MNGTTTDRRFYAFCDAVRVNLNAAMFLLNKNPEFFSLRSSIGETPVHVLATEDSLKGVEWLIENGFEIDPQNQFMQTPLMEVAALGRLEMCKFLISKGSRFRHINARDESVLSAAAENDHVDVVKMLLDLLQADEDINAFFDNVEVEMVFKHSPRSFGLLVEKGLRRR